MTVFERTFAAVIFDMDGTLIDSMPAMIRAWTQWALEHEVTAEQLRGFFGVPSDDVVKAVLGPAWAPAATERIAVLEEAEVDGILPLPGTRAALESLGEYAAIATSSTRPVATARLRVSGLPVPAVVITVDEVRRGKPAPDIFLAAADALGVDPADCLVVEDAVHGLAAARAAGSATLAVATTTAADELVADVVVADLSAVRMSVDGGRVSVHRA